MKFKLENRLIKAGSDIKGLLKYIYEVENNDEMSGEEKLSEIKKIKEKIVKVSEEIDNIKKSIILLGNYNTN